MNSKLTGEGDEDDDDIKKMSESQTKAGNQEKFKNFNFFKRGCYISCRDDPRIMTAIILDQNGRN